MRHENHENGVRNSEQAAVGQSIVESDLIRQRRELAGIELPPLINEQKIRRSRRIALNRKYKRKCHRSNKDRSF